MKIDAGKGFILNLIILHTHPADKALLAYQPYTPWSLVQVTRFYLKIMTR